MPIAAVPLADPTGPSTRKPEACASILGRDTWRQIESDLREYDTMLRRLGNASALKPLPEPNAETAVRLILNPPPATPPPN